MGHYFIDIWYKVKYKAQLFDSFFHLSNKMYESESHISEMLVKNALLLHSCSRRVLTTPPLRFLSQKLESSFEGRLLYVQKVLSQLLEHLTI